jgi:Permuted papain-like amidase enzyme, YaeF/YiiX, C92 family
MLNMTKNQSREKLLNDLYSKIVEIAQPGDLLFYITQYPCESTNHKNNNISWRQYICEKTKPWWKQWLGFDRDDYDAWHVGIYFKKQKRIRHQRINPWIIHSTVAKGVHVEQVTPGIFVNKIHKAKRRVEILRFNEITEEQRKHIIDFAYSRVGSEYDHSKWKHTLLPYALGVPNVFYKQNQFSCQQLVIAAYAKAEIYFTHPFASFPIFNIGRYMGYPLGHQCDRVNVRYPYLMDHHLYRDPRFLVIATVYHEPETGEIRLERENLNKYSWNDTLKERYRKLII